MRFCHIGILDTRGQELFPLVAQSTCCLNLLVDERDEQDKYLVCDVKSPECRNINNVIT